MRWEEGYDAGHDEHHDEIIELKQELADLRLKYAILLESRDRWMTAFEHRAGGPC